MDEDELIRRFLKGEGDDDTLIKDYLRGGAGGPETAVAPPKAIVAPMLEGGPLEGPWAAYGQPYTPPAKAGPKTTMADLEERFKGPGIGELALEAIGGAFEGLEAIGGGILFPIEAAAETLTENIPNVLAGRGSMGEPSLDAAPFLPRTPISRRMMEGRPPPPGATRLEAALESGIRAGATTLIPGMGIEAAFAPKGLQAASATLKAGKPLSQAERAAVMDATGATRVTPEGALTVAGKETTVEEMILSAGTKHADPSLPPMDAIERVSRGTSDATIGNALTGGAFGQAMLRGAAAVRALPGQVVDEALDLLPPSVGAYLRGGRKQAIGGEEFAKGVQEFQRVFQNIPDLATSKGVAVREAFKRVSDAPEEAMAAVYDNLMYGIAVPQAIRDKYGEAMPALRRTLSDLQALRREMNPEDLEQYPIWFKRMFTEPLEKRAAKGRGPGGPPVPGLEARRQAQDAYILNIGNLSTEEADAIIARLPKKERPVQPMAPGRSKGVVEGTAPPEWVGKAFGKYGETSIKWPDTPEGRAGWKKFQERLKNSPLSRQRKIDVEALEPIPREFPEGAEDALTEIKDLHTIMSRSWSDVLRAKATKDFFAKIPTMTDDAGEELARFVPHRPGKDPELPPGYEFMTKGNAPPEKRWGILEAAEVDGKSGRYAVRSDVAAYLREAEEVTARAAHVAHGALDRWAINATNAPKTGIMNWLYNKVVVELTNGILPGSGFKKRARDLVRSWENTEVADPLLEKAMQEGLPLRKPDKGMASLDDVQDTIFAEHRELQNADYEAGARAMDNIIGSPLAEQPVKAAMGGAAQGALRGAAEGGGVSGATLEAALGALETTALRPVARKIREKYVNSDLFTTVAVFLKNYDEALKAGVDEATAVKQAVAKSNRLTQAGLWGKVGGFSEALGAAPSGLAGGQRTAIRAVQKAFLNRFIKFHEVNARFMMNALEENWQTAIGAALGAGSYYAIKEGGRKAAESMGILSPEESEFVDLNVPDGVVVPIWDFSNGKPAVVTFPGQSVGAPVADVPDDLAEAFSMITGPAYTTTVEIGGTLKGKAQDPFRGGPLARREPEEGTTEEPVEALVRALQGTWMSPYASTGRLAQNVREGLAVTGEEREMRTPPSVPMIIGGLFVGPVRPLVPEELKESNLRAFGARRAEIDREARSARSAAIPGKEDAWIEQADRRTADLAEEYLRKGMKLDDLVMREGARDILIARGWGR